MEVKHTVRHGEHLAAIAHRYGFRTINAIWDHPANADLRARRRTPNILAPGDVLVVPERAVGESDRPTDARHRFTAKLQPLLLRIRLRDLREQPILRTLEADTGGGRFEVRPDGEVYAFGIQATDTAVALRAREAPKLKVRTVVGALDPVDTPTGQRDRLYNLGYPCGFGHEPDPERMAWAVQEFQCDRKLAVTGVVDDATRARLEADHGC